MHYTARLDIYNKKIVTYVFGVIALAISAQLSIPLRPVPVSMQTLAIMYIGIIYPKRCALLTITTYIGLGALGLPIFTNYSGGLDTLLSPRGGYIIGFALAILIMTHIREHIKQSFLGIFTICLVGSIMVFTCGITWLSSFIGIEKAIELGLLPFIIPGLAKTFLLSIAIKYTR